MRYALLLLCLLCMAGVSKGVAQQANYQFSRIDIRKGLSHNQVNAILKDSKGFMWFGTMSGLNRYDGYEFRVFRNEAGKENTISDNYIEKIIEGPDDNIWILTRNGINVLDPRTEKFNLNATEAVYKYKLPDGNIADIFREKSGAFWFLHVNKGLIRYDPGTKGTRLLVNEAGDTSSICSNEVSFITQDADNYLWLIHRNGIIEKLNKDATRVIYRSHQVSDVNNNQLKSYTLFADAGNDLWIFSANDGNGILFIDQPSGRLSRFGTNNATTRLNTDIVRGVLQDNNGLIWIATDHGGVNVIDKKDFSVRYILNTDDEKSISQNTINSMYKDRSGIIWIGTYKKGISFYHENIIRFPLVKNSFRNPNSLPYDDVNCFSEDKSGNLWIGSNGGGLFYLNRQTNTYRKFVHDPSNPHSLANDVIVNLFLDKSNKLWVGTYYGGLDYYDGTKFIHYKNDPANTNSIADNRIYSILEDSRDNIWIGTLGGGLDLLDFKTGHFSHYRNGETNSVQSQYISSLLEDAAGNIWIGTAHGIDILERNSGRFVHYGSNNNDAKALSNNNISNIFEDSRGWIWIGTREGLNLFRPASKDFQQFTPYDGLPDNTIQGILEDDQRNVWVSTANGISMITISERNGTSPAMSFKNYDELDGLQGKLFNVNAHLKTSRGELLFGGGDGFNIINPKTIRHDSTKPPVVITDFQLFNRSVAVNENIDGKTILRNAISETNEITLPYSSNFFSLEFAALNFFHPEKNQYRYKLEGLNNEWLLADAAVRKATFTNLDPGNYVFRVQASNDDGLWHDEGKSLIIKILPPFWKTPLAFVLYTMIIIAALLLARTLLLERERMKFSIEHERQEAQRMHYLDMMKIRFFTNISHEFRTPLTLILSPLQKLIKTTRDPDKQHLVMIYRNAKRLLNLVNQLLDFRRLELEEINLSPARGEIISFIKDISYSFSDLSEKKNIHFHFSSSIESLDTWVDHDKLEKVMFNLLSNAFKFTPENGEVEVELNIRPQAGNDEIVLLDIKVRDTGIGIPAEKQEKIFERFFQHELPETMMNQGSGIGLAITHEFVKLHQGTITVESEPDQGSTFTVTLPVRKLVPAGDLLNGHGEGTPEPDSMSSIEFSTENIPLPIRDDQVSVKTVRERSSTKAKILLVEDNEDFRFYLKDNLRQHYQIVEAANGKEGWKQLLASVPDLVVTDIAMPVMDGIELCRKIRQDPRTEHLPVILLTARSAEEQQLEGLETGANDFITKPFNFELLQSRIKNLIHQKQTLQKVYEKQIPITASDIIVSNADEKTVKIALSIVEKNISNPDFSVEDLSRELYMSRVGLYKKLVSLTGKTPIEFIRTVRLKRAAQLLDKTKLNISEIAYEVGFNNPKYFSKYFKAQFGMLPSQYQAQKKSDESSG
ncbi:hybrid sensor histidine kinase/response regulator transcription factor [Flavitalea sp.]|nr:two-component regulator propeller domain-containing protein [Flavitalea sp.]